MPPKNLDAWIPRFTTSVKRFVCFPLLPGQPISPVSFVVPCCPQHKSATHYSVFLLLTTIPSISLHFCSFIPWWTSPSPKQSVSRCPHLKLEYPSTDTARLCVSVPSGSTRSPPSSVFFCSLPMECLLRSNTVVLSPTLEPLPRDLANPTHHSSLIHTILGACALDIPSPRSLCNLFQPPAP